MGNPAGGNVAYGYQRVKKDLVLNEAEVGIVRMIFELAALGRSGSAIAGVLNDQRLPRRNGKPWTQRQVAAVLSRRELYRNGALRYGEAAGQNRRFVIVEAAA